MKCPLCSGRVHVGDWICGARWIGIECDCGWRHGIREVESASSNDPHPAHTAAGRR